MSISTNFPTIRPSLLLDFADTRLLDPRITFTRASTATYYDATTSAVAEQNLLLQSQTFDNASWSKVASSVTADTTVAPDGTTTADSIIGSAGVSNIAQITTITTGLTYVFSVYAKVNTTNYFQIAAGQNAFGLNAFADFDLSLGTVGTVGSSSTASITSVGNGWYRCILIAAANATTTANNAVYLSPIESSTAVRQPTNVGATSIYLWGAQIEQRSAVTAYTVTTTAAITNYIPVLQTAASGAARFDCNPTTRESLGLLIEESRTNLVTYSSDYTNAAWTKTNCNQQPAANIAPDGTLTASKIYEDTTTSQRSINRVASPITVVNGSTYSFSFYAKAAERTSCVVYINTTFYSFNLANGTCDAGATIVAVGNGWYRCVIQATANSTSANPLIYFSLSSYLGNGYNGFYLWGAQLEAGTFATSYIPTVASQVTRAADAASMTGTNFSSWYNVSQGSLYCESKLNTGNSGAYPVAIYDGTGNNYIRIANNTTSLSNQIGANGTNNVNITAASSVTNGTAFKNAFAFSQGFAAESYNGGAVTQVTTTVLPTVNQIALGGYGGALANTTFKRITYYPVALTSTQIQALTLT
jgi:hypothetical protein